jgi:surface protein
MKINLSKINLGPDAGSSAKIQELVEKTFTKNGSYTISPDEGYDAIADAKVNVNVTTPLEVWTDIAEMKYAYSEVSSFPSSLSFAPRTGDQAYHMFSYSVINTAPDIDFSGATSLKEMFYYCSSLITVPNYDTSSVTNFNAVFYKCSKLKNAPSFDVSKGVNFDSMYNSCSKLANIQNAFINIPENPCTTYRMFYQCTSLKYGSDMLGGIIGQSSDVRELFRNCTALISATAATIGEWTLSESVNSTACMFDNCVSLVQLPCIDMTYVTNTSQMLFYCTSLQLLYKGGLKNLKCDCDLSTCTALTHDSLVDLFNVIATVSGKTLTLGSTNLAKLTDEEKAIATGKGWTLA